MFLADANPEPAAAAAWRILEISLWLVGSLLAAAMILQFIKVRRQRARGRASTLSDQLSEFRQAFERGEMSKDEFERIHAHMTGRLQASVDPGAVAPPSAADGVNGTPSANGPPNQR